MHRRGSLVAIVPLAPVLYRYATVHSRFGFARGYWRDPRLQRRHCRPAVRAADAARSGDGCVCSAGPRASCFRRRADAAVEPRACRARRAIVAGRRRCRAADSSRGCGASCCSSRPSTPPSSSCCWCRGRSCSISGSCACRPRRLRKPVQVVTLTLLLGAGACRPVCARWRAESRVMGFYLLAAVVTWVLALGPDDDVHGESEGFRARITCLMALPGVDSLRVPARFWLMTTICLSVVAGLVVSEFCAAVRDAWRPSRLRSSASAVLSDGWNDRIGVAPLPPPVPGAAAARRGDGARGPSRSACSATSAAVFGRWTADGEP